MDILKFTHDKLSVEAITDAITSPKCGANSLFVGTTRDNFEGRTVVNLEYEAYESMGIKAMEKICAEIRSKWASVENIAIYHRLGTVPVKEASIVIGISAPHRAEAMAATQWCIDTVKESVPIWKKEIYAEADNAAEWKENKESRNIYPPKIKLFKAQAKQEVKPPYIPPHLIQIHASSNEINERIDKFITRKREEINKSNIRDFCRRDPDVENEFMCARIDSVLMKRKDSLGHLKVDRVLNTYSRDQSNSDYLKKHIPENGVEERVKNLEFQLNMNRVVPSEIYKRLKRLEDRLIHLESISPEYRQFWRKNVPDNPAKRKKIFSIDELDSMINNLEKQKGPSVPTGLGQSVH